MSDQNKKDDMTDKQVAHRNEIIVQNIKTNNLNMNNKTKSENEVKENLIIIPKPNYWNHWKPNKVNQAQVKRSAMNASVGDIREMKREMLAWKKKRYYIFSKSFLFRN